jgi:hypothetical protein
MPICASGRVGLPLGFPEGTKSNARSSNGSSQSQRTYNDIERRKLILPSPVAGFFGLVLVLIGIPSLIIRISRDNLWLGAIAVPAIVCGRAAFVLWLFFHAENVSAAPGIDASAARYSRAEDVHIVSVVVAELKFSDVQRQIFLADLVTGAHGAALRSGLLVFSNKVLTNTENRSPPFSAHLVHCQWKGRLATG